VQVQRRAAEVWMVRMRSSEKEELEGGLAKERDGEGGGGGGGGGGEVGDAMQSDAVEDRKRGAEEAGVEIIDEQL
jgi:hypothetical protein